MEETWRDDEPVLMLGEWCRRYSRRQRWEKMNAVVLPYHWDDRARLYADYQHIQEVYERLLVELAERLNEIHRVDHGVRYWRILVGPWLGYFIQILFDRWTSIQAAVTAGINETIVLAGREWKFVPHDMSDFNDMFLEDEWNHHIYAIILKEFTAVRCVDRAGLVATSRAPVGRPIGVKRRLQRKLADWYSKSAGLLAGQQDAFLLSTYLPFFYEIRLHGRLRQVPQLWRLVPPVRAELDPRQRQWVMPDKSCSNFEVCVRRLIPLQIPRLYLEGYASLISQVANLPWPRRPRVIWTSNSETADEVFKAWAAEKTECGAPLVIGQHGGHYGTGLWSFTEDHQVDISDRYFSWGWTTAGNGKIMPVGQLKAKRPLGVQHAQKPRALLVTAVHPRYSYMMYSTPVAGQWLGYFTDQFRFVEQLPPAIQQALTVRLYPQDGGWDQYARWRDRFPTLRLDLGGSNILDEIRQSRLYISTYNATTFLESFTMNVPTVIYWNPQHWELRESSRPYFDALKKVGVFHETPESAAKHIATIWGDVAAWWNSPGVQEVLGNFKTHYCHLPDNLLDNVELALRKVMEDSQN
jgi:putative transferase (TIGR04331 family)